MIRFPSCRFAAILASALLAGCASSPPVHYHALTPPAVSSSGGSARMLVEMLPIALPERLNRDEMVLTAENGSLSVRDNDHWAAPLSDEIRQMVADALWRQDGAADVYRAPIPAGATSLPQYRLSLRIERFEAAAQATVEASWSLRKLPQGEAVVCRSSFSQPMLARTPEEAAAALSAASARLSDAVAASLAGMKCP